MFRYLSNKDIHYDKWDACIGKSENGMIYGLSWFLDIVSPNWDGVVKEVDNEYVAVFPVPKYKKFGMSYIKQPLFTQQLGLYHRKDSLNEKQSLVEVLKVLDRKFLFILSYGFNEHNQLNFPHVYKNFIFEKRLNHIIRLDTDYGVILKDYRKNRKYSLKSAQKAQITLVQSNNIENLISIFDENIAHKIPNVKGNVDVYKTLIRIFDKCLHNNMCFLIEAKNENDLSIGSCLFLIYKARIIYLFSAVNEEGKAKNVITLIIDSVLQKYQSSGYVFDFEGSSIEDIASFYRSFGSEAVYYPVIKKFDENLSKPYFYVRRMLIKFIEVLT